jgi:hypothetical protein
MRKLLFRTISCFVVLIPLLFSCTSKQEWDVKEAVTKIFAPDEHQYRRFETGMNRTEFDAAYTGDAIYGNEMEVIDSLTVSEGVYCETAFRFKNQILTEISVQIVIDSEEKKDELLEELRNKLTDDYGEGIKEDTQHYWRAEGGLVTTDIFLTDHSSAPNTNSANRFVIVLFYTVGTMVS